MNKIILHGHCMPPLNTDIVAYMKMCPDPCCSRFMHESKLMFVPDVSSRHFWDLALTSLGQTRGHSDLGFWPLSCNRQSSSLTNTWTICAKCKEIASNCCWDIAFTTRTFTRIGWCTGNQVKSSLFHRALPLPVLLCSSMLCYALHSASGISRY